MDTQEIRRRNLAKVKDADFEGHQARMAEVAGCAASSLSRILHGKKIEDKIRVWERAWGYQVGALDRLDFEPTEAFRNTAPPRSIEVSRVLSASTVTKPDSPTIASTLDSLREQIDRAPASVREQVIGLVMKYIDNPEEGERIGKAIEALLGYHERDDSSI